MRGGDVRETGTTAYKRSHAASATGPAAAGCEPSRRRSERSAAGTACLPLAGDAGGAGLTCAWEIEVASGLGQPLDLARQPAMVLHVGDGSQGPLRSHAFGSA